MANAGRRIAVTARRSCSPTHSPPCCTANSVAGIGLLESCDFAFGSERGCSNWTSYCCWSPGHAFATCWMTRCRFGAIYCSSASWQVVTASFCWLPMCPRFMGTAAASGSSLDSGLVQYPDAPTVRQRADLALPPALGRAPPLRPVAFQPLPSAIVAIEPSSSSA